MSAQTAVSGVHTFTKLLQNQKLKEILSIIGRESQLDDLQNMVTTIDEMLRKAEPELHTSNSIITRFWIDVLRNAVCEANAQLEKFIALAERKQLLKAAADADADAETDAGSCTTLSKKTRLYYYRFNCLGVPYKVSQVLNRTRIILDIFVKDAGELGIDLLDPTFGDESSTSTWENRGMPCSYVDEENVIGRKDDLENVIGMLLDSNNERDVSFLSIAGIRGLGKTTLAQLVYNDSRVIEAFPLRMWISVSDRDQDELNVENIIGKILGSASWNKHEFFTMDQVQSLVQQRLSGQKYLLVLDDVRTEKPDELHHLVNCLIGGQRRSCIIVTTRSRRIATAIQDGEVYELQGLSKGNSWQLLQRLAFGPDEQDKMKMMLNFLPIILDTCAGNPLALTVAGHYLFADHEGECLKLCCNGFCRDNSLSILTSIIYNILIMSYSSLESPLKSCFLYCALFPKDVTIDKDMLISLWMAQGYIDPLHTGVSGEDVGDEYFSTMLDKYFLKDIKRDKYGEIVSCKIHDFIPNFAGHLAKSEMDRMSNCGASNKRVRHVSFFGSNLEIHRFLDNNNIISYIHVGYSNVHFCNVTKSSLELLLAKCRSLKALDLGGLRFESLPDAIGELSLLRYLNLCGNSEIEILPRTMTRLHSLQTLNLQKCCKLKELPNDFSRLVNLRLLNIRSCSSLTCMPRGIGKLTCLHKLSDFRVSDEGSYTSWKQVFDALEDLRPLDNLQGDINIDVRCPNAKYVAKEIAREGLYPLMSKECLKAIEFDFNHVDVHGVLPKLDIEGVTRLMKELQPPSNLQYIKVWRYQGVRMGWDTFSSNLVQFIMVDCWELECLPCLGNLRHLRVLQLLNLKKLEYIGEDVPLANSGSTPTLQLNSAGLSSYYPSLETLRLENLPKLKAWRRVVDDYLRQIPNDGGDIKSNSDDAHLQLLPCFSHLKSLFIWNCLQLTWIPPCPMVEDIKLVNFNSKLHIIKSIEGGEKLNGASLSPSYNGIDIPESSNRRSYIQSDKIIKKVVISNVVWLNYLPIEAFKNLEKLEIWCDKEVESLGKVGKVFLSCSYSLRVLIIHNCNNMKSVVRGGLKHLTSLEILELRNCDNLTLLEEQGDDEREDNNGIHTINWSPKLQSLHTLKLEGLPRLVNLPAWIQFLPCLHCLCISFCSRIQSMPDWMPKIKSLHQILVHGCSASLEKRCREQEEDWPHIQFLFRNCVF